MRINAQICFYLFKVHKNIKHNTKNSWSCSTDGIIVYGYNTVNIFISIGKIERIYNRFGFFFKEKDAKFRQITSNTVIR